MDELLKEMRSRKRSVTHNCPECGSAVKCEIELGKSVCWCMYEQTSREPEDYPNTCLCKECLTK